MTDRSGNDQGPLSSADLERDAEKSGQTTLHPEDAAGHTLPASEADSATSEGPDENQFTRAGQVIPPD